MRKTVLEGRAIFHTGSDNLFGCSAVPASRPRVQIIESEDMASSSAILGNGCSCFAEFATY